jgi:hypothetical protein
MNTYRYRDFPLSRHSLNPLISKSSTSNQRREVPSGIDTLVRSHILERIASISWSAYDRSAAEQATVVDPLETRRAGG